MKNEQAVIEDIIAYLYEKDVEDDGSEQGYLQEDILDEVAEKYSHKPADVKYALKLAVMPSDGRIVVWKHSRNIVLYSLSPSAYFDVSNGKPSAAELNEPDEKPDGVNYISQEMIDSFQNKSGEFNYDKLVGLLKELNTNYSQKNAYATAMLIRGIIDHIPPLFGFYDFQNAVSKYNWHRSDEKYPQKLLDSKAMADEVLHRTIDGGSNTIDMEDIPPKLWLQRILAEALLSSKKPMPRKSPKKVSANDNQKQSPTLTPTSNIEAQLLSKEASWANYVYGLGFRVRILIDNFGLDEDYLMHASVTATDASGDPWQTDKLTVLNEDTNETFSGKFHIKKNLVVNLALFCIVVKPTHGLHTMPDLDRDTGLVRLKMRSGKVIELRIYFAQR